MSLEKGWTNAMALGNEGPPCSTVNFLNNVELKINKIFVTV